MYELKSYSTNRDISTVENEDMSEQYTLETPKAKRLMDLLNGKDALIESLEEKLKVGASKDTSTLASSHSRGWKYFMAQKRVPSDDYKDGWRRIYAENIEDGRMPITLHVKDVIQLKLLDGTTTPVGFVAGNLDWGMGFSSTTMWAYKIV